MLIDEGAARVILNVVIFLRIIFDSGRKCDILLLTLK